MPPSSETSALRAVPRALFALLFPEECRVCGEPLSDISRVPVCRPCLREPQPLMPEHCCVRCRTPFLNSHPLDEEGRCGLCRFGANGFDAAYSFGSYEGTLRKLIHLFKYSGIHSLARPLGERLASVLPRDERFDMIVPMPLHWRRRWQRGFNQSKLLAGDLARRTGLPLVQPIGRTRSTSPQAGLSNAKRRANVSGAFSVRRRRTVDGRRVLLVDDVFTTGATASACAWALKRAGAGYVAVITLARTDRRLWVNPETTGLKSRIAVLGAS